jgi:uncharacterized membrane protein
VTIVLSATHRATSARWVPFGLVALSLIPVMMGVLRLGELGGGPHVMPANPRIDASPAPVVVHLLSVIPYSVLGAFQFSAGLRRRLPGWHRNAGRLLVVLGLVAAFSGLWMTAFYPRQPGSGILLYVFRLAAGTAMAASVLLGFAAIRRGAIARHRAWMTRAYALALGAGTQAFTGAVVAALPGAGVGAHDLGMGAAWVINLGVAEYAVRRGHPGPKAARPAVLAPVGDVR